MLLTLPTVFISVYILKRILFTLPSPAYLPALPDYLSRRQTHTLPGLPNALPVPLWWCFSYFALGWLIFVLLSPHCPSLSHSLKAETVSLSSLFPSEQLVVPCPLHGQPEWQLSRAVFRIGVRNWIKAMSLLSSKITDTCVHTSFVCICSKFMDPVKNALI